jgi:DNA-binding transcriptional MocR family regulator
MSKAHPRPWHRGSVFGDGPRRPLDREQRARFRFLLNAHARANRLPAKQEKVGLALLRRLGANGQCDPSHDTLTTDTGVSSRTVRRALSTLKALGLLLWQCRIVRDGPSVSQTSNAYVLVPASIPADLPSPSKKEGSCKTASSFVGHVGHRLVSRDLPAVSLAQIAAQRLASGRLQLGRCRVARDAVMS